MKKIDMTEYFVTSKKFPQQFRGFTFAVLSDLHSNVYGISLKQLLSMIRSSRPDAILIIGDMINAMKRDRILRVTNFIAKLAKEFPVFYALGNHEYKLSRNEEKYGYRYLTFRNYLMEAGVNFIVDDTVFLEKDDVKLALSGVAIDEAFYEHNPPEMGPGLMDHHLGTANTEYYNLLMAHHPYYFAQYAGWGADLTLAGHLHGGIIRTSKRGLISTTGNLFRPYFDEGEFVTDTGARMIVSRGLGTHHVLVRINNHPELVVIHLQAEKE